jgi:hypothetical protein
MLTLPGSIGLTCDQAKTGAILHARPRFYPRVIYIYNKSSNQEQAAAHVSLRGQL